MPIHSNMNLRGSAQQKICVKSFQITGSQAVRPDWSHTKLLLVCSLPKMASSTRLDIKQRRIIWISWTETNILAGVSIENSRCYCTKMTWVLFEIKTWSRIVFLEFSYDEYVSFVWICNVHDKLENLLVLE